MFKNISTAIIGMTAENDWRSSLGDALKTVLTFLLSLAPGNKVWGWTIALTILIVMLLLAISLAIGAVARIVEALTKAFDTYQHSGLPVITKRREHLITKKRQQF